MKKIGILAVKTHNYGSLLQTYALQKVVDLIGYENEIINYKKTNYLKQALRLFNIPLLKQSLAKVEKKIVIKTKYKDLAPIFSGRTDAFNAFIENYLRFSKTYIGRNNLEKGAADYDCFVLGSDQVWNPMNYGADFFSMTFVPDNKKKVAYAPSFGVTTIPKHQLEGTKRFINRIDCLSVRETSGKELIKNLTGRDAKLVVDPTILLKRKYWDQIKGNAIIREPYIFCYFLGSNENHRRFANELREKTGYKIVTLPHMDEIVDSDFGFGDIVPDNVGPEQFINLISNAAYVCTDSFHGTVFSILYHRVFFAFNRYKSSGGDSTNSRLNSILDVCGLGKRKFDSSEGLKSEMLEEIDYGAVDKRLTDLRAESMEFLVKSIT